MWNELPKEKNHDFPGFAMCWHSWDRRFWTYIQLKCTIREGLVLELSKACLTHRSFSPQILPGSCFDKKCYSYRMCLVKVTNVSEKASQWVDNTQRVIIKWIGRFLEKCVFFRRQSFKETRKSSPFSLCVISIGHLTAASVFCLNYPVFPSFCFNHCLLLAALAQCTLEIPQWISADVL